MRVAILGAGLAGVSMAYFLQDNKNIQQIDLFEKESQGGGLCQSIQKDGYIYDIGPHIIFSKDKEILEFMLGLLEEKNSLKRSNKIIYDKTTWVNYPFENDLSKLNEDDLNYCIHSFNNNPYENYKAENMLQFFLKTFGEGITNLYLRPYNEKIWKFDPVYMDTSMVDRIPKPTTEEIQRSASGETVEGYLHQLYFSYPSHNGIEDVFRGLTKRLGEKTNILLNQEIRSIGKIGNSSYEIETADRSDTYDLVISTIPPQELIKIYKNVPAPVKDAVDDLKYNSIMIAFVKTKRDCVGDHFAFMIPDKDVLFHRISKMDFLGSSYDSGSASYMVEITYRDGDHISVLTDEEIKKRIKDGLCKINFAENMEDVEVIDLVKRKYAYVVYDLDHRKNMGQIRQYFGDQGVYLNGRFGNFEYWNMDRVIREAKTLAEMLTKSF